MLRALFICNLYAFYTQIFKKHKSEKQTDDINHKCQRSGQLDINYATMHKEEDKPVLFALISTVVIVTNKSP